MTMDCEAQPLKTDNSSAETSLLSDTEVSSQFHGEKIFLDHSSPWEVLQAPFIRIINSSIFQITWRALILLLALFGLFQLFYHPRTVIRSSHLSPLLPETNTTEMVNQLEIPTTSLAPSPCTCGASIAEARTNGCKYDALASAWLPPACRDDELTAEFDRSGPGADGAWTYFADPALTHEISVEEVSLLAEVPNAVYYSTWEWHVVHCLFYWRKQFRQSQGAVTVERRYDNYRHVVHCQGIILNKRNNTHAGVALWD